MKVELSPACAVVTREPGDPKIYKESTFFYHVKKKLIEQGHDVIVKVPEKDQAFCHLYSAPYYIRSRKHKKGVTSFWLVDDDYMLRCIYELYNREGSVRLLRQSNIFDKDIPRGGA